jgi:hypothetical protein
MSVGIAARAMPDLVQPGDALPASRRHANGCRATLRHRRACLAYQCRAETGPAHHGVACPAVPNVRRATPDLDRIAQTSDALLTTNPAKTATPSTRTATNCEAIPAMPCRAD